MIWLRMSIVFEDANHPDIELECVDLSEVTVKPGEEAGPYILLPIQALPLQMDIKPLIDWGYWDGICWRLCSRGEKGPRGKKVTTSGGKAIDPKGIAGVVVLPETTGAPRCVLVASLYEKATQ